MEYKLCQCVEPEDLQNGNLMTFVSAYGSLLLTVTVLCWRCALSRFTN